MIGMPGVSLPGQQTDMALVLLGCPLLEVSGGEETIKAPE
jgi:hypothetical protein